MKKNKKFFAEVGATAAQTLRLVEGSEYCGQDLEERKKDKRDSRRQLFMLAEDAWFAGSVKVAESISKLLRRVPIDDEGEITNMKLTENNKAIIQMLMNSLEL